MTATSDDTATGQVPSSSVSSWWSGRFGYRFLIELGLVATLLMTYRRIRLVTQDELHEAFENTRQVIHFEQWLGLLFEWNLQQVVLEHTVLISFLNHYYVWFHFPVAIALFVWLYALHLDVYRPTRNLMAVVTFAALGIHVVFPLAPPRLIPGFVDTMYRYGPRIYSADTAGGAANQIAAMPSLHFGWAVIAAMAIVTVFNSRWRWLAVLHPVVMLVAIVATANHWWVDAAVAGLIIVAVCGARHVAVERRASGTGDHVARAPSIGVAVPVDRGGSVAGGAVERLPEQVGVATVAGVLLDEVHEDPPEIGAPTG